MNKSFVPLSVLQQKAKQLQKEKSLKWSEALDESAIFYGFSNFKNYKNMSEANRQRIEHAQYINEQKIFNELDAETYKRIKLLVPRILNFDLSMGDLLDNLQKSTHSKQLMRSLCESSPLKEYLELNLLKFFLEEGDFDAEYHIPKQFSVKNLRYKLEEGHLYIEGYYEGVLEFGFEHDKNDPDNPDLLNDLETSGWFELTIDRNCVINFDHIDGDSGL